MKILIVEDEALIAMAYADALEGAGYVVVGICASVEDAMAIARETPPDLVLADLRLGQQRCGATVEACLHEAFGSTGLYITANVDFAQKYRRTGIGYVEKPIGPRALVAVADFAASVHRGERPSLPPRCLHLFEDRMAALPQPCRPALVSRWDEARA